MYIRFGAGVLLVVAISVTGVAIEKEILSVKRELSHQAYREEVLLERHNNSRLLVQELSAPERVAKRLEEREWVRNPDRKDQKRAQGSGRKYQ